MLNFDACEIPRVIWFLSPFKKIRYKLRLVRGFITFSTHGECGIPNLRLCLFTQSTLLRFRVVVCSGC
jgi:hypothetical protein